ncbi:hypothetical protein D3C76_881890 [compost metagenome]
MAFQVLDVMPGAELPELLFPGLQQLALALVEPHVAVAVLEVRVDAVPGDARLDDRGAEIADFKYRPQALFAHAVADLFQVMANAGHHMAAVAPGAAKAEVARLEQHHVLHPAFHEFQRRVHAGEAAANNDNFRVDGLLQVRELQVVFARCGVVRGGCFDRKHVQAP